MDKAYWTLEERQKWLLEEMIENLRRRDK